MADVSHDTSGPASSESAGIALQQASQPASPDRGKLRVFISYSRDDLDFADQLAAALDLSGFECFIDREGISGGEAWKQPDQRGRHNRFRSLTGLSALPNLQLGSGGGGTTQQAHPSS
jgi:TIR domain